VVGFPNELPIHQLPSRIVQDDEPADLASRNHGVPDVRGVVEIKEVTSKV